MRTAIAILTVCVIGIPACGGDDASDTGTTVPTTTGTLVSVGRDGARRELADDVLGFVVPFEGTPRERNEVLYVVYHPERGGLWRFVLP